MAEGLLDVYLESIRRYNHLPFEEQVRLGKIKDGSLDECERSEAAETLINSELNNVVIISKSFRRCSEDKIYEMVQEGNVGLVKAVRKWDYTQGVHLGIYCRPFILACMRRYLSEKSRTIKIPDRVHWKNVRGEVNLPVPLAYSLIEDFDHVDARVIEPIEQVISREEDLVNANKLSRFLGSLEDRTREIIKLRFGLEGKREHDRKEIAEIFGMSSERIRQIERSSLVGHYRR